MTKKTRCAKCGQSAGRLSLVKGQWLCGKHKPKQKPTTVIVVPPWH